MSNEISNLLIKNNWTAEYKILNLPNSIDLPSISEIQKSIRNKVPVIGSVSNFRPQKDHETLIRAFKILCDWTIDCELWLVGDVPTKPSMEKLTYELNLQDKVRFVATILDLSNIYSQFDVFALSSHYEGHPLVVLEAMSFDLPTIAARISSIPETITNNFNGLLVNPQDPEDLASAIKRLLEDKQLAKKLGEAGRKYIEKQPTLKDWANKLINLYEDCLSGNK